MRASGRATAITARRAAPAAKHRAASAPVASAVRVLVVLVLLLTGLAAARAAAQDPSPTPTPTPEPTQTPTPEPTQSPTPESISSSAVGGPRGVADLIVLQRVNTVTAYLVDGKTGAIYSRSLAAGEKGRIALTEFKRFHTSPELKEPSGLAHGVGKLLVCDKDRDVLLEVDLTKQAERVLLRKGAAGGFAEPTSVAASLRRAVAVGSDEAGRVWVRPPGAAAADAFVSTPLPRGVTPSRLFFVESDLFIATGKGELYRLANGEAAPGENGVVQRISTGFDKPKDIVYHGGLLYAAGESGLWVEPYTPPGAPTPTQAPAPSRAVRLADDAGGELSRLAVTADGVLVAEENDPSVRVIARPPSVSRLRLQGEHLYWLEPFTNAVSRMRRKAGTILTAEQLWTGARLEDPTGLAVNGEGTVYVVDRKSPAIYGITPGAMNVLYAGPLLKQPADIAAGEGVLYVLDSGSRKLLSFDPARKVVIEEYAYDRGPMPDRLSYHKGNLLAFATGDNVLDRFVSTGEPNAGGGPYAEWQLAPGGKSGTVRRGQRFQLRKALGTVADFDHVEDLVYFLDAERRRLVLLPLEGGEPTSITYDGLARMPTSVAADERELFLVDGHRHRFNRAPALLPITIDFEGKWTPSKLVNLYGYLLDHKLLTTRPVVFPNPVSLETLALETVPTGDYVVEFRALFCRLNSSLCDAWGAQPQAAPQGAELIPANRSVIVPDLRIDPYRTQRVISLPLDTDKSYRTAFFKKYVNGPLGQLALEFLPDGVNPTELPQRLLELNPQYKGPNIMEATAGDFVIPIRAARVYAAAPRADVLNAQSRLSRIVKENNVTAFSPALMARPRAVPSGYGASRQAAAAPLPAARRAPDPRCATLPPGVVSNAMEIINYCFPRKLLDTNDDPMPPPQVGVIDNLFNHKHPIFGGEQATTVKIYKPENATVETELDDIPEDRRPQESTTFLVDIDHGTHMAALIGAPAQENVMTGFYPRARIQAFPSTTQLSVAMDQYRTLGLFNLSLGEKSGQRAGPGQPFVETAPFIKLVENFPLPLFVVSAGNDNQPIREHTLASFGYLDNVLVVGATTSPTPDPQNQERPPAAIWVRSKEEGSSFHKELVGVVAPGEAIKSALWNNGYGTADGTSPATAMVTGAAAVLMNVTKRSWEAWKIKFRLIASADLWTDKEHKQSLSPKVFSGVLNMRRAVLDTSVTVAEHKTNGVCRGSIPVEELDKELRIRRENGALPPLVIKLRHILRFARSGDSKYTIIYYENRPLDDGKGKKGRMNYWLKRADDVEVFDVLGGNVFKFDVSQETAACRSGAWNLISLNDFLNTFYQEQQPATQRPPQ